MRAAVLPLYVLVFYFSLWLSTVFQIEQLLPFFLVVLPEIFVQFLYLSQFQNWVFNYLVKKQMTCVNLHCLTAPAQSPPFLPFSQPSSSIMLHSVAQSHPLPLQLPVITLSL